MEEKQADALVMPTVGIYTTPKRKDYCEINRHYTDPKGKDRECWFQRFFYTKVKIIWSLKKIIYLCVPKER